MTALSIVNPRMSVDVVWEQLATLLPRWPLLKVSRGAAGHRGRPAQAPRILVDGKVFLLLQEMLLHEHDDLNLLAVSMLAGDMLEDMHT